MLTVLGNMRINSRERFEHFQHSFTSFNLVSDNWLINIRGSYREEASAFLRERLNSKMIEFELLDDKCGWINNALEMLKHARHKYVMLWNEDHINMAPQKLYARLTEQMYEFEVDYLMYTWWCNGISREAFSVVDLIESDVLDVVYVTRDVWQNVMNNKHNFFLISFCGIFKKDFLIRLMEQDSKNMPLWISKTFYKLLTWFSKVYPININNHFGKINRFFNYKIGKFSRETPFDLEKEPYRIDILPFVLGLPRQELFACIDDDIGVKGTSLISRGLYPGTKENASLFVTWPSSII